MKIKLRRTKLVFLMIFNHIIFNMILGFIWYKLGFAQSQLHMLSGADTLKVSFLKYQYIYYSIVFIMEFLMIVLCRKLFDDKKTYIKYYVLSVLMSLYFLLRNSIGFETGIGLVDSIVEIKERYIFIACVGLRYNSYIFTFNIPSLLGFAAIIFGSKKKEISKG